MAEAITMPKLGFDMAEGTLVNWVKKEGDVVNNGDVIAEIETDKATIEIETYVSGTILALLAQPGDVLAVGSVIGWVGEAGEKVPAGDGQAAAPAQAEKQAEPVQETAEKPARAETAEARPSTNGRSTGEGYPGGVKASPVARKVARDKGIDLKMVQGTGPGGRIVKADVESYTPEVAPARPQLAEKARAYPELPNGPDVEIVDTSNLRKRIANRMIDSKQQVPHFYLTVDIDVKELLALRKQLNASVDEAHKISVNDLVVKATALTLRDFPNLNSHFYGDKLARYKRIHIGIAVALPGGGLMNVVVRDADKISLGTLSEQAKTMIARARDGKVKPDEVQGATFTVSNLGAYNIDHFSAIINPPEAGILAIGQAKKVPVVLEDGTLGVGERMKVTLSVDHRVSDGAEGAEFLKALKELLENPVRLVL